jgi:hypothetical protein
MNAQFTPDRTTGAVVLGLAVALAAGAGVLLDGGSWAAAAGVGAVAVGCAVSALRRLTAAGGGTAVPAWDRVRSEIERARRLNSSLVVARLPLRGSGADDPRPLADQAASTLRGSDSVWVEGRSILVLLADADRDSAQHGIDRVLTRLGGSVVDSVAAAFPGDEVTLGGLVDRLYPPRRVRGLSGGRDRSGKVAVLSVDGDKQATA